MLPNVCCLHHLICLQMLRAALAARSPFFGFAAAELSLRTCNICCVLIVVIVSFEVLLARHGVSYECFDAGTLIRALPYWSDLSARSGFCTCDFVQRVCSHCFAHVKIRSLMLGAFFISFNFRFHCKVFPSRLAPRFAVG
jgi:hypothetical protein